MRSLIDMFVPAHCRVELNVGPATRALPAGRLDEAWPLDGGRLDDPRGVELGHVTRAGRLAAAAGRHSTHSHRRDGGAGRRPPPRLSRSMRRETMADADPRAPRRWTRRPLFSPSQMLTAEQLNLMMDDQRARTEKLMRGLHGHGVIFGLAVTREEGPTPLEGELRHGARPPRAPAPLGRAAPSRRTICAEMPECEDRSRSRSTMRGARFPGRGCGPCSDRPQWIEEGVVYQPPPRMRAARPRLRPRRARPAASTSTNMSACATAPTRGRCRPPPIWQWACGQAGQLSRHGLQRHLLRRRGRNSDRLRRCSRTLRKPATAIRNGASAKCSTTCEVRPWVYRTPLLYELIKGCQNDLARVESVRWGPELSSGADGWPDDVPWEDFAEALRRRAGNRLHQAGADRHRPPRLRLPHRDPVGAAGRLYADPPHPGRAAAARRRRRLRAAVPASDQSPAGSKTRSRPGRS